MTIGDILETVTAVAQLFVFFIKTGAYVIASCAVIFLVIVFFQAAWMSVVYLVASVLSLFL